MAQNFNEMSDSLEEKIEQLRQSDLEKQQFIDNLGHELRTPLTTISGYAEYLQMAPADEEEKLNALGYIISEAKRLGKLSVFVSETMESVCEKKRCKEFRNRFIVQTRQGAVSQVD